MPRLIALLIVFLALASAGHGFWQLSADKLRQSAQSNGDNGSQLDPDGATANGDNGSQLDPNG